MKRRVLNLQNDQDGFVLGRGADTPDFARCLQCVRSGDLYQFLGTGEFWGKKRRVNEEVYGDRGGERRPIGVE